MKNRKLPSILDDPLFRAEHKSTISQNNTAKGLQVCFPSLMDYGKENLFDQLNNALDSGTENDKCNELDRALLCFLSTCIAPCPSQELIDKLLNNISPETIPKSNLIAELFTCFFQYFPEVRDYLAENNYFQIAIEFSRKWSPLDRISRLIKALPEAYNGLLENGLQGVIIQYLSLNEPDLYKGCISIVAEIVRSKLQIDEELIKCTIESVFEHMFDDSFGVEYSYDMLIVLVSNGFPAFEDELIPKIILQGMNISDRRLRLLLRLFELIANPENIPIMLENGIFDLISKGMSQCGENRIAAVRLVGAISENNIDFTLKIIETNQEDLYNFLHKDEYKIQIASIRILAGFAAHLNNQIVAESFYNLEAIQIMSELLELEYFEEMNDILEILIIISQSNVGPLKQQLEQAFNETDLLESLSNIIDMDTDTQKKEHASELAEHLLEIGQQS